MARTNFECIYANLFSYLSVIDDHGDPLLPEIWDEGIKLRTASCTTSSQSVQQGDKSDDRNYIWVIPPSWATKCDILLNTQALYFYYTTYTIVTSCLNIYGAFMECKRSTDRLFKDVFFKYLQNDVSDEQETGFLLLTQHRIWVINTSTSVTELYYDN